jgi:hypothetical protein
MLTAYDGKEHNRELEQAVVLAGQRYIEAEWAVYPAKALHEDSQNRYYC